MQVGVNGRVRRKCTRTAALWLCAILPHAVQAQAPPPGVFSEVPNAVVPHTSPALEPATMRSRVVQIDTKKITAARRGREALRLNLFDDATVEVDINRVRPTRTGYFISGTPKGKEAGEVRLVVNGAVMVGTVETPESRFTIRSAGRGRNVIRQIDPSKEILECAIEKASIVDPSTLPSISSLDSPNAGAISRGAIQADEMPTEDGSEVRVLVLYTPALEAAEGGTAGMRALIDLFVASANQAFEDSGIIPRLVLAAATKVDYVAQGAGTDLDRLTRMDDGYMDEVHALRNEHAADLVHLLTNVAFGAEGLAGPLVSETLMAENYAAFAVTANGQEQTFTHEIGHNFGMMHDRYSFGSAYPETIYPYAFGYVNPRAFESDAPDTARWRTIMSTQDRCRDEGIDCTRLLRFANPDQNYMDDPLGVSTESTKSGPDGPADARTTIINTARWVGSFRSEACTDFNVQLETPFAPVGGGEVILKVDAPPGCLWEASSQADFLTISSGARYAGSAYVNVAVDANPTDAVRTGLLTVADSDVSVRQLATADGVCGRSPAVTLAIARASGFDSALQCDEINDERLAGITSLDLRGQSIRSLKAGDFEGLSGLETLEIYNNRLNDLPNDLFSGLSSLNRLSLSNNELTELPAGLFAGLTALQDLQLNHNQISDLSELVFADLSNLEDLDVSFNLLDELPGGVFSGLAELEDLNLLNNRLRSLPEEVFSELSGLRFLRLGSNQLTEIPEGLFTGLSGLQTLQLFHNQLAELPAGIFSGLSNLEDLSLSSNQLEELPESLFFGLSGLKTLSLPANQLVELDQDAFASLHALRRLNLGFNQLTGLDGKILEGLSNLEELSLERNKLENLPEGVFLGLTALRSLNVRRNSVDPLPLPVSLRRDAENSLVANVPTGAPFTLELSVSVSEAGKLEEDASSFNVSVGNAQSEPIRVVRREDTQDPVTVDLTMPSLPSDHFGYVLQNDGSFPLRVLPSLLPDDAALIDLSMESGTLIPPFQREETGYRVFVANSVATMTVTPLASNAGATVEFRDENDETLADADSDRPGHQAGLAQGENTIRIHVTSADGMSSRSYTVVAVRDGAANVCVRTPRIRDAIMEAAGVGACTDIVPSDLSDITELRIQNNGLTTLASHDFAGLAALEYLDLRFNRLSSLPAGVFAGLTALQTLNLHDNRLTQLPADVFSGLTALRRLFLSGNRLTELPEGLLPQLTGLTELDLGTNRISDLPENALSGLSSLEKLDLRYNRFKRVSPDWFSEMSALRTLSLQGNSLSGLSAEMFLRLRSLLILDLGDNRLTQLPDNTFSGLLMLEQLDLSGNRISNLTPGLFSGLSALQTLELDENRLSSLPSGIFSGLSALQSLRVQRNTVDPLVLAVSLDKTGSNEFKAVAPAGAPFNLAVSLAVRGPGAIDDDVGAITIPTGALESSPLRVARNKGTEDAIAVDIVSLPQLPEYHAGYALERNESLPRTILPGPMAPPPAQVSGVEVTAGAEQLDVSWLAVPQSSGYKVQWKSGDEDYDDTRQTVVSGGDTIDYTITGLTPGTEYTVRVIATKAHADDGEPSDEVTGIPRAMSPDQVMGVALAVDVEQLEVSWEVVSGADGYRVEWKSGDEDYDDSRQVVLFDGSTTSHLITDLIPGAEYAVRVIATKAHADDGAPSEEVTGIPKTTQPAQVTGVAATPGIEELEVSWDALSDADGYRVEWKSGEDDYDDSRQAVLSGGSTTGYTVLDLTPGTEYTVRVIATREHAADGEPSEEVTAIPKASPPAQVTGVAVAAGFEELQVSWDAVSDADGYKVQWKSGDQDYDDSRQVALLGGETTSYTIIDLTTGTEYTIRVIATKDHADDGEPSGEVTGTPASPDPDVNGDGTLDGDDAQAMYQAYASEEKVGDGESGGTAESRRTLLSGLAGTADPSDDDLKAMLRKANVWRSVGLGHGGDINEDGAIDGDDAFVMYYAYEFADLVGDGETGGTARHRRHLLASRAGQDDPSDEDLKKMLRRANKLREDFG